ncbi:hypothetical protein [Nocardia sp. NBC_00511]|uniref:hypothetical protein n=1 Tax=Nocardia sp. NBC_00511 TaxID=2903591 RepID=UPI0030E1A90D
MLTSSTAHQLLAEILNRYGTIDAFCAHLRTPADPPAAKAPPNFSAPPNFIDPPTIPLPVWAPPLPGRHRMSDPAAAATTPVRRVA